MNIEKFLTGKGTEFVSINGEPVMLKIEAIKWAYIPDTELDPIREMMANDYKGRKGLDLMNIETEKERLMRYTHCKFGGMDNELDIEGRHINTEYFECPFRKHCPPQAQRFLCRCFPAPYGTLFPAEIDVLIEIGNGLSEAEIAAKLGKGFNTVHSQSALIRQKIGARSCQDVVRFAVENGFIS